HTKKGPRARTRGPGKRLRSFRNRPGERGVSPLMSSHYEAHESSVFVCFVVFVVFVADQPAFLAGAREAVLIWPCRYSSAASSCRSLNSDFWALGGWPGRWMISASCWCS